MNAALDLRTVASALGGKVEGDHVRAPGPGHSTIDDSLIVWLDPDSPEGFRTDSKAEDDWRLCREHVRAKLGLTSWTPTPGAIERMSERVARSPQAYSDLGLTGAGYSLAATYDYCTDGGDLLYQVLRYEHPEKPKTFRQRRPDGRGGWYNDAGERRVLYRSADRNKVAHSTVWITEGEKDADRLAGLNLTATTAASGKWTEEMARQLAGYDCLILEDNDEPGRKKAAKLAELLSRHAGATKIIRVPGLAEGEDVSDWLDAGGSVAQLRAWGSSPPPLIAHDDHAVPSWAVPFKWIDPAAIPVRAWLYGRHYIRQFVSTTFSPGGVGKSSLVLAEAMALASGKPLLGIKPVEKRVRVAYWNGEDPFEETMRRAMALALHYGLEPHDLEGWLFLGSGRDAGITIAKSDAAGALIIEPNVERVVSEIQAHKIDVVVIDPFVSSHKVAENDNGAIDTVAKEWGRIAGKTNTAVELVHHTRKTNGAEITVEDGRGAGSLLAAARSGRVLNPMSKDEAERAGVESPYPFFRVEDGKANMSPRSPQGADWYRMAGVDLGNGGGLKPSDNVGVVTAWKWPDPFDGVSAADLLAVQQHIDGGHWRENVQAKEWVGRAVAEVLELDLDEKTAREKVKGLLKTWFKSGALVVVDALDEHRKARKTVGVGRWVEL